MEKSFFIQNRKKLLRQMKNNSMTVLFSGRAPIREGDEKYPFSPNRNFYYITGLCRENMTAVLIKCGSETVVRLYIPAGNGALEKWVGKNMEASEASVVSGIEEVYEADKLYADIADSFGRYSIKNCYLDLESGEWEDKYTPALLFAEQIRKRFPMLRIKDIAPLWAKMRQRKQSLELKQIQRAIDITQEAFEEVLLHTAPGRMEYELEAHFDHVLKRNGVRQTAFRTILASGRNATILHYQDNTAKIQDGDLILMDAGAQYGYYHGDLTRTFPASGVFSDRQRLFYNIVLEGQRQVIEKIKPGVPFSSLNQHLRTYYFKELKKQGLLEKEEEVSRYYWHGVSHHLGLYTHDVGERGDAPLKEGMVLTVEPGLYLEEYGIGIRIEDDVLVTDKGCRVLSAGLLKKPEEIESFMASRRRYYGS